MKIENFHHIIRAAAAITDETVFVVVGSQAILAQFPNAPPELTRSQELDIYPKFKPELSELIEGSIGADLAFHGSFGYHADGVGPETAKLPGDWEMRALRVQAPTTGMAVAICPEANDLVASKLLAGRDKDVEWVRAAIVGGFARSDTVADRLALIDVAPEILALAKARLKQIDEEARR